MAENFKIEVDDKEVIRAIQELQKKAGSMKPAMNSIGGALKTRVQMGFLTSTAPDGTPWKRLKHRSGKPLMDTRVLRNSITFNATDDQVEVGTNIEYGAVHQFGKAGKKRTFVRRITQAFGKPLKFPVWQTVRNAQWSLPARPFLPESGLPQKWVDGIVERIQAYLIKKG